MGAVMFRRWYKRENGWIFTDVAVVQSAQIP